MTPFARWAVEHGLILVATANSWCESADGFLRSLWTNAESLHVTAWIDALCDAAPIPLPVLPPLTAFPPCALALTPAAAEIFASHGACVLFEHPIRVFGLLDPTTIPDATVILAREFPDHPFRATLISPHSAAHYAAVLATAPDALPAAPFLTHAGNWAALLGPAYRFEDPSDIIAALWNDGFPVLPASFLGSGILPAASPCPAAIFFRSTRRTWVVSPNPADPTLVPALIQSCGLEVIPCACPPETFASITQNHAAKFPITDTLESPTDRPLNINTWGSQPNELALWQSILTTAIDIGASDIHLEPKPTHTRVRFRVDGTLRTQAPLEPATATALVREIKKTAEMDHNLTGRPQDGARFLSRHGRRFDQRYSVLPTAARDESVVVRILDSRVKPLADLDLAAHEISALRWALAAETGMIVVSGPTGSGKTTTLYALLDQLNQPERKLITVEDPVEKHFEDAVQIGINDALGWTWSEALKYALRQDPDILLIGELRDSAGAQTAVRAANTGHKVLTTVHANDAVGVIPRLSESFAIDHQTLAIALRLIISQRLVPRLCPLCRQFRSPTATELAPFPDVPVARPVIAHAQGCPACKGTGHRGRSLIADILPVDATVAEMIATHQPLTAIRTFSQRLGFRPLITRATTLLLTGEISLAHARQFVTRSLPG